MVSRPSLDDVMARARVAATGTSVDREWVLDALEADRR